MFRETHRAFFFGEIWGLWRDRAAATTSYRGRESRTATEHVPGIQRLVPRNFARCVLIASLALLLSKLTDGRGKGTRVWYRQKWKRKIRDLETLWRKENEGWRLYRRQHSSLLQLPELSEDGRGVEVGAGTSNLTSHLRRHHPQLLTAGAKSSQPITR